MASVFKSHVSGLRNAEGFFFNAEDYLVFIENSKNTKRVCQSPELTGDKLFSKMKIYPSINEGLNAFNKKNTSLSYFCANQKQDK